MYDKLGRLLNETLETGEVEHIEKKDTPQQEMVDSFVVSKKSMSDSMLDDEIISEKGGASAFGGRTYKRPKISQKPSIDPSIYFPKSIPPEVEQAFKILGIKSDSPQDEIKRAYKEKLKYFHPDHYIDNPVLYKIATDKTRLIMESYNILVGYMSL